MKADKRPSFTAGIIALALGAATVWSSVRLTPDGSLRIDVFFVLGAVLLAYAAFALWRYSRALRQWRERNLRS